MPNPNLGRLIVEAWETEMLESPAPFIGERFMELFGGPRHSYRYWLDKQPRNFRGDLIPRIVTVRRNLRALGNIRLDPRRLV